MADYSTSFSSELPMTAEQRETAEAIIAQWDREELEDVAEERRGFTIHFLEDDQRHIAWMHSEQGNPDHVILFLQLLAERAPVARRWGFTWAHSCSKPRPDAFGGGAAVVDLATSEWWQIDTYEWMTRAVDNPMLPGEPFRP